MSNVLSIGQVTDWQARYGCQLTQYEIDLLTGRENGSLDDQRRHVLIMLMLEMECPACQHQVPPRAALGRPPEWGTLERTFTCTWCRRGLKLTVALIGHDYWRLAEPLGPAGTETS